MAKESSTRIQKYVTTIKSVLHKITKPVFVPMKISIMAVIFIS